jgi:HD-GYP domain-containing protein (c-di-GMP phosphodiesterase class II)
MKKVISTIIAALLLILLCTIYLSYYFIFTDLKVGLMQYLAIGAVIFSVIIIMTAIIYLRHNILQPYSHLYKGIDDIGLGFYTLQDKNKVSKKMLPVSSEIDDMFEKIKNIMSLIGNLNNNSSFTEMLRFIYSSFSAFIPYNYIGIALISEDKKYLKASYGVADNHIKGLPDKLIGACWPIKETSLKELIRTGDPRIINDLEKYCENKPLTLYNKVILEAGIRASITLPLKVSGEPVGVIFFSSVGKNVYKPEHLKLLHTLANSISISLNQNIYVNDIIYSSILALAKLSEARDEETGEHLNRMSVYSRLIAELLYENNIYTDEVNLDYIERIERYSPLHDIGKVGIRDNILLKPGKLTPEEFDEMKHHTAYGAEVLRQAEKNMHDDKKSLFHMGVEISEGHHEKWDGSGYPHGRKGFDIPLCARIVAVADVFDALTSKRPYKQAFTFDAAMEIISEGKGSHFDPVIADIFLTNRDRVEREYHKFLQDLSSRKIG